MRQKLNALRAKLGTKVKGWMEREDGPTAVEYAVMLALIIVVCLTAIAGVGTQAQAVFTNVGGSLGTVGT